MRIVAPQAFSDPPEETAGKTRGRQGDLGDADSSLLFEARTTAQPPYKVYWQVVNTGEEARKAKGLHGGFDEGVVQIGGLQHKESALYAGNHSIECFIVKSGYCVARSGPFIVNIA